MRAHAACLYRLWLVRELITRIANHADLGPNASFLDKLMATEDLAIGGVDLCKNAGRRKLIHQLMALSLAVYIPVGHCTGTARKGA
jgi:hypothetical protein